MTLLSSLAGDTAIETLLSDTAQLTAMLAFEGALAEASAAVGWIGDDAASAITKAIANFAPDLVALETSMAQDGVVVPGLVKQLRATVADPHKAALHKGATSQDVIDTALILQIAQVISVYEERLSAILKKLDQLAQDWAGRELMAHTRMQVALPSSWDAKLQSWIEPLQRYAKALAATRRTLLVVQLGGPVGDRGSFDGHGEAIVAHMAQKLDLGIAPPWQTIRDPIVAFGSLVALISGTLGKIGADITLLAQNEVGVIRLAGGGASSAMAHKSNPVNAEVLIALARANAGLAGTLQQAMVHEYERSGAAWTLEWLTLPQMLVNTGASLRLGAKLFEQMTLA